MARLFSLFLVLIPFFSEAKETLRPSSKVNQVTLYRSAAEVQREAQVNLPSGEVELVFSGLSNQLYDQSFQVSGKGDWQIVSISSRVQAPDRYQKEAKYIRLNHELNKIEASLQALQAELNSLNSEEQVLAANKSLGGSQGIDLQKLQSVSNYYRQRIEDINLRKYAIQEEQKQINLRRNEIQRAINDFVKSFNARGKELVLKIESAKNQAAQISFTYVIYQQVSWQDQYNLYFEKLGSDLKLQHKALVQQSTGEDWLDVSLSFSTGAPSLNGSLPDLSPHILRSLNPTPRKVRMYADAMESEAPQSISRNNEVGKANFRPVNLQNQSLSKVYKLNGRFSLSSGSEENIHLLEHSIKANYKYRSIPKLSEKVYLEAMVKDWEELALESGEFLVYNQGSFINRFYFDGNSTKEMRLSLGSDPSLSVMREKLTDQESSSFLGSNLKKQFRYRIKVKNLKQEAVDLEILDQIPLSSNEKITVEILDQGQAKLNAESGELSWEFKLASEESRELNFSYEVSHPKDLVLSY